MSKFKVLLIGNPNSGKTTVFNYLTGSRARTANWHGVTVDALSAPLKSDDDVEIVDLPGIYSLSGYSLEEKVTSRYAFSDFDLAAVVIEAVNLKRALSLVGELKRLGKPIAVIVNMYGELQKRGGVIDFAAMSRALDCPVWNFEKEELIAVLGGLFNGRENLTASIKAKHAVVNSGDSAYFTPPRSAANSTLDRIFLNKLLFLPAFALIAVAVFYVTFGRYGAGAILAELTVKLFELLKTCAQTSLSEWGVSAALTDFVSGALIDGCGAVLKFAPQLCILSVSLTLIEESGLMSRLAFMLDGLLEQFGLNGRLVFGMLIGLGCTALAITTTRGMENKSLQKRAVMSLQFVACGARVPVFMVMIGEFFPYAKFAVLLTLYILSITLSLVCGAVMAIKEGETQPFIMELAPYRLPSAKNVGMRLLLFVKQFIIKIGTCVLALSSVLWVLKSFTFDFRYVGANVGSGMLAAIGGALSFMFAPIGIRGWEMPVAVLGGLVAKETLVSTLALVYGGAVGSALTVRQAIAMTVFFALYTPCFTALITAASQVGVRVAVIFAAVQFTVALIVCYAVNAYCLLIEKVGITAVLGGLILICGIVLVAFTASWRKCAHCPRRCDGKVFCDRKHKAGEISAQGGLHLRRYTQGLEKTRR